MTAAAGLLPALSLTGAIASFNVLVVAVLFILTLVLFGRRPSTERLLVVAAFGSLALGLGLLALPGPSVWATVGMLVLTLFPYLLLRMVTLFGRLPWYIDAVSIVGWIGTWALVLLPNFSAVEGAAADRAVILVFVSYLVFSVGYASYAFVRGAYRVEGVQRRRMAWAAWGCEAIVAAALVVLIQLLMPETETILGPLGQVSATLSFLFFFVAFTPPPWLLRSWHFEELDRYLREIGRRDSDHGLTHSIHVLCQTADRVVGTEGSLAAVGVGGKPLWVAPSGLPRGFGDRATRAARGLTGHRSPTFVTRESDPSVRALLDEMGTPTAAVAPIGEDSDRQGVLVVPLPRRPMFLSETLALLQRLGEHAALALREQKHVEERERLLVRQAQKEREVLHREAQAYEEANRVKSQFLANMSHEFRTPLNSILGFARILDRVGDLEDRQQEFVGDILRSAQHLNRLVNDVLDLAKVEAGRLELEPEDLDLEMQCQEVAGVLRQAAADKGHVVTVEVDESVRMVRLDPTRLTQVLYNYLSNAIKFTPEGGHIQVRATPEAGHAVRIEVEDDGVGISRKNQARLFREFEQLELGAAKRHQGTGLGLALVRHLVEAQGGSVGVSSKPGQGSVFHAVLPRDAGPGPQIAQSPLRAGPRVLVVEDDATDRAWMVRTLTEAGYAVDTAGGVRDAARRLRHATYDALVLDLLLPDGYGRDVLDILETEHSAGSVPVVVVSVVPEHEAALGFRVQGYLHKPCSPRLLRSALEGAGIGAHVERPVLVVQDDPKFLKSVSRHVQRRGYRLLAARSPQQAMEQAEQETPSVVVLDLSLAEAGALEFLKRFRSEPRFAAVPVVLCAPQGSPRTLDRALRQAVEQVVTRSGGGAHRLLRVLDEALRSRRREEVNPHAG